MSELYDKIKNSVSEVAFTAFEEMAKKLQSKLKKEGLMPPDIALIGLLLLESNKDEAIKWLKISESLEKTIVNAEEFLKGLKP